MKLQKTRLITVKNVFDLLGDRLYLCALRKELKKQTQASE